MITSKILTEHFNIQGGRKTWKIESDRLLFPL